MKNHRILLALFLIYFVFAILLNSVGTVILQVIGNYGISKSSASVLEGFKDLLIAVVSFLVASFLTRIGYKNAMLAALALVCAASVAMPLVPSLWTTKLLFLCVGVAFALVKVSVYSTLGLIATDRRHHASIMNTLEGFFMVGVLSAYWVFGYFIDSGNPKSQSWLHVYWVLAGLCAFTFVLVLGTSFDERTAQLPEGRSRWQDFTAMLKLFFKPLVCVFVITAFLYVLIEQSVGTWLPTFNNEILKLPEAMSVEVTSIFAACLAIGRLSAGVVMRKMNALAAVEAGVDRFDASLGGLGGCPYAPGATGNICTEDLTHMLALMGYDTGVDLHLLLDCARALPDLLGHDVPRQTAKAGMVSDLHPVPEWLAETRQRAHDKEEKMARTVA